MQLPVSRSGDRETMSEREEDTDEEDGYDHGGRSGQNAYGVASGSISRHHDRERSSSAKRDHSASREMSVSPRSDRRSQTSSAPLKPAKVTLVKSRKNEGKCCKDQSPKQGSMTVKKYVRIKALGFL